MTKHAPYKPPLKTAFQKGRPAPLVDIEPQASSRSVFQHREKTDRNLANDMSRWASARGRARPLEASFDTLKRAPR